MNLHTIQIDHISGKKIVDGTFITKLIFGLHTVNRTQRAWQIEKEKITLTLHETLKRKF
jgi:hypothetical protein